MTTRGRGRLIGAILAAVLVLGCLGYLWQRTDPKEGAARNYLKALATGDGELACTLVTREYGQEIAARHAVSSCPDGVGAMLAGLSSAERERLGDARLSGSGDLLTVGANPLGIGVLRVSKVGEEWLVAGDR